MTPELWQRVEGILGGALELPEPERAAYLDQACGADTRLRAEVDALLAVERPSQGFLERPEPSLAGQRLGPWRLLREIGRGGMGTVYLAERADEQFTKTVAVKVMTPGLSSREMEHRFRAERRILASLEHPHIARLLDAGTSPEGVAFLVMEYIEGASLYDYAQSHGLDVTQLLALFQAVCSAVHFAHQRLVVHRDLKPANILVTAGGTPKLLDFGVAKMLAPAEDAGPHATLTGYQPMTPDYASPEQIGGHSLTTATDIFSLGVILFELLTGRRPLRLSGVPIEEAIRIAAQETPPPPSRLRPGIAPDLDAIVAKAMRKEPDGRYTSAGDLAADIGRYLAGLPVEAHRGAGLYRARKFVARHRMAVAAALVAVVLGVGAASAIVYEARLADRRYRDVRKLANSVLYELHDAIAPLPGSTGARKLLVTRATEYLDTLARETGRDNGLKMELAGAYARVGDVQGHPGRPNLGDSEGALASYAKSQAILESLAAAEPGNLTTRARLALANIAQARVLSFLRRPAESTARARAALAIWQDILRRKPAHPVALEGEATAWFLLADQADNSGDGAAALENRQRALTIFERLLAAKPEDPEQQRNVALCLKALGSRLADSGRWAESRPNFERALDLDRKRSASRPLDGQARLDVAFDLGEIGHGYERDDPAHALGYFEQSLTIRRELAASDPLDARIRGRVAYALMRVGSVLGRLNRQAEGLERYTEAAAIADALVKQAPEDVTARGMLVRARAHEGRLATDLARQDRAHSAAFRRRACQADRLAAAAFDEFARRGRVADTERAAAQAARSRLAACPASGL
jgi:eukaryotic-like serine/threonine-protein kinase